MSVMRCNRGDCENVMCDRLSHSYGYICNECFEELIGLGPTMVIAAFMQSMKPTQAKPDVEAEARARYDTVFPQSIV